MLITERIREKASKINHTFASIERELELANGSIRKWDISSPSSDKLLKVANLLNVTTDWLLTGEGDPRPSGTSSTATPPELSETEEIIIETYRKSDKETRVEILKRVLDLAKN